jgi:capsular exopolysaccharide synthesis family protein
LILPTLTSREVQTPDSALQPGPARQVESQPEPAGFPMEPEGFQPRTLPLRLMETSPILPFQDDWRASEQYRIVRTKLIQHPKQPRMIVVSSAGPGDGKSVTAANIAGVLALKSEANVLLMDADFRRSRVHVELGLPQGPGLADLLVGSCSLESALIRAEQLDHLYVLTAGTPRANPVELLDSSNWRKTCEHLRKLFRYIIVDCPPIGAMADYDLIQATCDGVIIVARPDHTNRDACMKALSLVAKDKMLGVLLNCVQDWFLTRKERYDGYYYTSQQ